MSGGPLAGIRVLDTTRALAGPLATMVLGDLGAEVLKVEVPGVGDETRFWGPPFAGDAGPTLIGYNRNKKSVAIDLRTTEGRQACLDLARSCDIFVENFRPGTVRRFGVDYNAVRVVRPDVIYCSISGYGQTGPMASRPAVDLMVQAVGGLMAQTGEADGRPMKAAAPVADTMGGLSAAIAILGALMERGRTGEGRYLDISMLDGLVALMGQSVAAWGMSGKVPSRWGNAHPLMAPYESFRTADREIVIAVTNEKNWTGLVALPDFAPLTADRRYEDQPSRNRNRATLVPAVEAILMTRPATHWIAVFDAAGIPVEPINTLAETLALPQLVERGMLVEVEYPPGSGNRIRTAGMPWRDVAREGPVRSPPALGEHTTEVLNAIERESQPTLPQSQ
ncbi:CaiB/BaiF CoA transferase family protein [Neoroseomonas lacus]|uniref:CoA transferase n=1 Tax=Neoroseomonas lacus TaxID=287609 RepID=A0A917KCJ0_9PROT|nr:CoA transferase [Neoroseomonas lacus]GGJ05495.1 CoA transferase [Neoroseomonas lacus]